MVLMPWLRVRGRGCRWTTEAGGEATVGVFMGGVGYLASSAASLRVSAIGSKSLIIAGTSISGGGSTTSPLGAPERGVGLGTVTTRETDVACGGLEEGVARTVMSWLAIFAAIVSFSKYTRESQKPCPVQDQSTHFLIEVEVGVEGRMC